MAAIERSVDEFVTFKSFIESLTSAEPFGQEQNLELIARIKAGSQEDKDLLVRHNRGLVFKVIGAFRRKIAAAGATYADAYNEACIGMVRAAERYEPGKSAFSTYAAYWVRAGVYKAITEAVGNGRMSWAALRGFRKVKAADEAWLKKYGVEPTIKEIAAETGMNLELIEAVRGLDIGQSSLSTPVFDGEAALTHLDLLTADPELDDRLPDACHSTGRLPEKMQTARAANLSRIERLIIMLRYERELALTDIAEKVGQILGQPPLSRERIRQLEKRALEKLHLELTGRVRPEVRRPPKRAKKYRTTRTGTKKKAKSAASLPA